MTIFLIKPAGEVAPLMDDVQQRRALRGYHWCVVNSEKWYVASMHKRPEAAKKQADQFNRLYPQASLPIVIH